MPESPDPYWLSQGRDSSGKYTGNRQDLDCDLNNLQALQAENGSLRDRVKQLEEYIKNNPGHKPPFPTTNENREQDNWYNDHYR